MRLLLQFLSMTTRACCAELKCGEGGKQSCAQAPPAATELFWLSDDFLQAGAESLLGLAKLAKLVMGVA